MKTVFSEIFEGMDMIGALLKRENLMEEDDRVYDLDDDLEKEMSDEMKEKYREFKRLRGSKDRELGEIVFIRGVRMGMQLMLDAILEREKRTSGE